MNIVLVHGILGFSRIGPVGYFNGVAEHLRELFRASVFAPALDPTAGTDKRSSMLRQSIQGALLQGVLDPKQPIHIIAHSMGGLDARRLISADPTIEVGSSKVPVKTLATIGTPHGGSPVADVVAGELVPKLPVPKPILDAAKLALGNVLGHFNVSLDGLHDLTTKSAKDFNTRFPDHRDVRYLSFAGEGRREPPPTSGFFLPYHAFIRICDGEASDGVVPVSSAKWTGFDANLWPADHADEIGHDLDRPLHAPDPATLARYDGIVLRFQGKP
jgi:triacylglycerol lipase